MSKFAVYEAREGQGEYHYPNRVIVIHDRQDIPNDFEFYETDWIIYRNKPPMIVGLPIKAKILDVA